MLRSLLDISPTGLQAVTLDVGGTLITPWPSVGHVYAEVAARNGLPALDPHELTRRFRDAWRQREQFSHTRSEWSELVDATFLGAAPIPPSRSFFDELYDRFTQAEAWRVYDDVVPALEKLKAAGLKLGIISNWDDRLPKLLENLKIKHWFNVTVVSCDLNAQKPARILFETAAQELKIAPGFILHVGDEPVADYAGAIACGFRAELLKRT